MRKRLLLILAVGLLLIGVAGAADFLECHACPGDAPDDECPPGCESCPCCLPARTVLPTQLDVRTLALLGAVLPSTGLLRRSADPQEIFHVPRPSLF